MLIALVVSGCISDERWAQADHSWIDGLGQREATASRHRPGYCDKRTHRRPGASESRRGTASPRPTSPCRVRNSSAIGRSRLPGLNGTTAGRAAGLAEANAGRSCFDVSWRTGRLVRRSPLTWTSGRGAAPVARRPQLPPRAEAAALVRASDSRPERVSETGSQFTRESAHATSARAVASTGGPAGRSATAGHGARARRR